MSEKSLRHNTGKTRWSLVNFNALKPLVQVLEFGATKYPVDNWKIGFDKRELLDSMQRHLAALIDGQDNDPESGLSHVGHIMCNAMFYSFHFVMKEKRKFFFDGYMFDAEDNVAKKQEELMEKYNAGVDPIAKDSESKEPPCIRLPYMVMEYFNGRTAIKNSFSAGFAVDRSDERYRIFKQRGDCYDLISSNSFCKAYRINNKGLLLNEPEQIKKEEYLPYEVNEYLDGRFSVQRTGGGEYLHGEEAATYYNFFKKNKALYYAVSSGGTMFATD